jgi:hypothetical protein
MLYGEREASVADVLLVASLPEEVRAAVARVYGPVPAGAGTYTEEDMQDAYEAGFEDCADQMERPYFSDYDFKSWLKHR